MKTTMRTARRRLLRSVGEESEREGVILEERRRKEKGRRCADRKMHHTQRVDMKLL